MDTYICTERFEKCSVSESGNIKTNDLIGDFVEKDSVWFLEGIYIYDCNGNFLDHMTALLFPEDDPSQKEMALFISVDDGFFDDHFERLDDEQNTEETVQHL